MDNSQIKLIKDQTFLNLRETISETLLEHGIIEKHNDQAGWWVHSPQGSTWISLYEVLEAARD